jgi:hypothetical protein
MNTNSRYFFNHTLSRDAVVLIFYGKMGFLSEKKKKSDPSTILNTLIHFKTNNDFVTMMQYKYILYFTVSRLGNSFIDL